MTMIRACDICGNGVDYANKHHDAGHGFTYAAQEVRPGDVNEGDRVRVTSVTEGIVRRQDGWIFVDGIAFDPNPDESITRTWELIERPKPEAKLGSVWVNTATSRRWVSIGAGQYALEAPSDGRASAICGPWNDEGRAIIARLVPAEEQV